MSKTITLRMLVQIGACLKHIRVFKRIFGKGQVAVTMRNCRKAIKGGLNVDWLVSQIAKTEYARYMDEVDRQRWSYNEACMHLEKIFYDDTAVRNRASMADIDDSSKFPRHILSERMALRQRIQDNHSNVQHLLCVAQEAAKNKLAQEYERIQATLLLSALKASLIDLTECQVEKP